MINPPGNWYAQNNIASNYGKQKLTESKEVKDKFLITVSSVRHKLGRAGYLFNVVEILRPISIAAFMVKP